MGLQHTGQSSMYDCSGTERSRVKLMVSQQWGQVTSCPCKRFIFVPRGNSPIRRRNIPLGAAARPLGNIVPPYRHKHPEAVILGGWLVGNQYEGSWSRPILRNLTIFIRLWIASGPARHTPMFPNTSG